MLEPDKETTMSAFTRKTDKKGRVTLPADFADHLVIVERVSEEELRVRKAKVLPKKSLAAMLAAVTPENLHAEVQTGPSVGAEVW
jgi:antitoxin component of MazEF toxin-antitoxin module